MMICIIARRYRPRWVLPVVIDRWQASLLQLMLFEPFDVSRILEMLEFPVARFLHVGERLIFFVRIHLNGAKREKIKKKKKKKRWNDWNGLSVFVRASFSVRIS